MQPKSPQSPKTKNMAVVYYSSCPVCQYTQLQPFVTSKDYAVSGETYQIVRCEQCKTALTQNSPDVANIGQYYQAESYISHSNTRKGLINNLYHIVRNYMLGRKKTLTEQVTAVKEGKLLDIGCGTGYFLDTMQQTGWQVQGIEVEEKARNFAIQSFGLQVNSPEVLPTLQPESFDVITLWHVLEHLHNLNSYLNQLLQLLQPQGTLIIAVPNYDSYDAKHYGKEWAGWDVPRHLWHFCPTSIDILAQRHELRVVQRHLMPFDSFYVSLLSEKYKNNSWSILSGFWHGAWSLLQAWQNPKKASSVIYVLKKI